VPNGAAPQTPADPQPQTPPKPAWRLVDGALPEGHDPEVPLLLVHKDRITIYLPHFMPFTVTGVEVLEEIVIVQTDLRIGKQAEPGSWAEGARGLSHDCGDPVVLEVAGLGATSANDIQVLSLAGMVVAPILGAADAVGCVEDEVATDFDGLGPAPAAFFDSTASRMLYRLLYGDAPAIDRAGSNVVSGTFYVDSVTGEVHIHHLDVTPLESTRQLADGCWLLDWTQDGQLLTIAGSALLVYDPSGDVVSRVETGLDMKDYYYALMAGSQVWFRKRETDEFLGIDAFSGELLTGECPAIPNPSRSGEFVRERSSDGQTKTSTLTVDIGDATVVVRLTEEQDAGHLSISVDRGGQATNLDTSASGDYILFYSAGQWAVDAAHNMLYLLLQHYYITDAVSVTAHLFVLDLTMDEFRSVTRMASGYFRLSPDGSYAVYQIDENRVLIVDLRPE